MSDKLISADAIKAELNNSMRTPANIWNDVYNAGLYQAEKIIDFAPAVDAVEVTRCEKCQYRFDSIDSESKEEVMFCNLEHGLAGIINSDDFCSYGERKGE